MSVFNYLATILAFIFVFVSFIVETDCITPKAQKLIDSAKSGKKGSSKEYSDKPDDYFGFHEGNITVENMHPHRVGHCHVQAGGNKKKVSSSSLGDVGGSAGDIYACTPDFMLIGSSKSGTSSLAEYLQNHPLLRNVNSNCDECTNEAHLFDTIEKTDSIVRQILTRQPGIKDLKDRHLVMEYTPNYLLIDDIPRKIKQAFPLYYKKLKFIVLLRDPVARAISSYKSKTDKHPELPDFADCKVSGFKQAQCIFDCYDEGYFNKTNNDDCNLEYCRTKFDKTKGGYCGGKSTLAHIVKSLYYYELLNWFNVFDRSQFLIVTIEQYTTNPLWVYEKIINFVGLPLFDPKGVKGFKTREDVISLLRLRKNITPPNDKLDKQFTEATKSELTNFYRPHNKRLVELLGWNPGYPI